MNAFRAAATAVLALALSPCLAAQEDAVLRKRPLRTYEVANSVRDLLLVRVDDLAVDRLPPLPPIHAGQPIPEPYRKFARAAADRAFDERDRRPTPRRWTIDLGRGESKERPGVVSLLAGQTDGVDPWKSSTFDGDKVVAHWTDESAVAGGERSSPGVRIGRIALPEAGLWRITLRVARAAPPLLVRYRPCVLEVRANGWTILKRELVGGENRFELVEAEVTLAKNELLDLAVGESMSLATKGELAPGILIDRLDIEGPIFDFAGWPPPSHRRLASGGPEADRREIVARFLRRAFRRPPTAAEVDRFGKISDAEFAANGSLARALAAVAASALSDPAFLYLEEREKAAGVGKLTQHEAAGRISYALFGTTPADELLDAADKDGVAALAEKLSTNPRAWQLGEFLAEDWLGLARLDAIAMPDRGEWPLVRDALRTEARAYFASYYVSKTRPVKLLQPDRLLLNRTLLHHYGLSGQESPAFAPLTIRPGHGRCGIPTLGAVLVLACDGRDDRSARRGAYVWRLLFAKGGEAPPADEAKALDEMLAPFDALGRWSGNPIGPRDISPLVKWLDARSRAFDLALSKRLGTYLIGYSLSADETTSADVVAELHSNKYATADLQTLTRRWLAAPVMWQKW